MIVNLASQSLIEFKKEEDGEEDEEEDDDEEEEDKWQSLSSKGNLYSALTPVPPSPKAKV